MRLKNLLIKGLRSTRWADFMDAVDQVLKDLKNDVFIKLKNKYNINESGIDNLKDLILMRGFRLYIYSGYSSTIEYLKRRNKNLTLERLYRTATESYKYILKSFWLKGNVYPLRKTPEDIFRVVRNPVESISSDSSDFFSSDQEIDIVNYFIGATPVPNPPIESNLPVLLSDSEDLPPNQRILTLDSNEIRDYTNHFIVEYEFLTIEEEDVFMSTFTAEALYRTINDSKKLKEVAHFQPKLNIPMKNTLNEVNEIEYLSYDKLLTSLQKNIWVSGDLNDVVKVQLGKGRNFEIGSDSITACNIPIDTYTPLTGFFNIVEQKEDRLYLEYYSYEYSKLGIASTGAVSGELEVLNFSEVALLSENDSMIAYAYFPDVNYFDEMYTSVSFDFSISSGIPVTGVSG